MPSDGDDSQLYSSIDSNFYSSKSRFRQVSSSKTPATSKKQDKVKEDKPKPLGKWRNMNKGKRWDRKLKNAKYRDTMINYYEYNCKTACVLYKGSESE